MVLLSISRVRLEERASTDRYVVIRMRKVEASTASGGHTLFSEDTGHLDWKQEY